MRIDRIAVVLCLIGLPAAPALAQNPAAEHPVAGVEVGFASSRVSPDASGQTITRGPGLLAGGYMQAPLFSTIGLQLELIYSQKHSHLTGSSDLNLDYIEVPILAKMKLFKTFYLVEGVALGFPVGANVTSSSGSKQDIKDQVNSPDIGIVIGGGAPVSSRVAIEGRYEGAFTAVSSSPAAPAQRNRQLSVLVRVKLR